MTVLYTPLLCFFLFVVIESEFAIYNGFKACICNIPIPLWVITGRGHFSNFEKNYPKEY